MNIQSLKDYILNTTIGKREYLLVKSFCHDNNIEIIDFFKKGQDYDYYGISNMFVQAFSKSIHDEEMLKYFIGRQKDLSKVNFKSILSNYNMLVKYQHLFGLSKEEELSLFIKEEKYNKILSFLKDNIQFQDHEKINNLIIKDFSMIEKFEKEKINFNKSSYEEIDIYYNNILGYKETNPNFIKADKFYEFIIKNKEKISYKKRKEYLNAIINYGSLTVHDFKKQGYWDYVFIPLKNGKEFPELLENKNFFPDIMRYKEQIISKKIPHNALTIMKNLDSQEKLDLLFDYIKNYKVKAYNYTAIAIFNNFINDVNENFINDFFKEGIEAGYIFKYSLKDEYSSQYKRDEDYKNISEGSNSMKNETIKKNHHVIAKQILKHRYMFKTSVLNSYIPIGKDILEEKEFIMSLEHDELNGLMEELKSKNLPNTTAKILEMRLENKLEVKGIKEKKIKI